MVTQSFWGEAIIILGAYFILIIVATYPMIDFFSQMPIGGGDSGQNSWNLWWMG